MPSPRRIDPGLGQESVWDYPRPPSLEASTRRVRIRLGGELVVDTTRSWRVCETSHPPVYYVPSADFRAGSLTPGDGGSYCEYKGTATYWNVTAGGLHRPNAGWSYENPAPAFEPMRSAVAIYPGVMDEVLLDEEQVQPQAGGFYGGWITADVVGPFKGEPGTRGW